MTCMNNILFMCVRVIDFDFILMTFRFYFRTVLWVWYVLFSSVYRPFVYLAEKTLYVYTFVLV
jgi:hypothetical protein